jgi:alpha-D-ribose 1-methylphosphonate 5-triphosphate synthase subunit PhnL
MSMTPARSGEPLVKLEALAKTFVLHGQGGVALPVFAGIDLEIWAGECVVIAGASGAGKSSLLRAIYGNYRTTSGRIQLRHEGELVDVVDAEPRTVLALRRRTVTHVSQFLRVIPRVSTMDLVLEPALAFGQEEPAARIRASRLLHRLNIPERLWSLAPATFSGGEQQRVAIARSFVADYPIMLLDEPTAALDPVNRQVVVELILEARQRGAATIAIFHDRDVRDRVATREFDIEAYRRAA